MKKSDKEIEKNSVKYMVCLYTCSDTSGRTKDEHDLGCPFYVSAPYYEAILASEKGTK